MQLHRAMQLHAMGFAARCVGLRSTEHRPTQLHASDDMVATSPLKDCPNWLQKGVCLAKGVVRFYHLSYPPFSPDKQKKQIQPYHLRHG